MPALTSTTLWIQLEGWLLQDGNYSDFEAGQVREFALQCYTAPDRRLRPSNAAIVGCTASDEPTLFNVVADVVRVGEPDNLEDAFVLVGLRAYHPVLRTDDGDVPTLGARLEGVLDLAVDPFDYFESLHRLPSMPPLIYRWTIEEIQMDTTPSIRVESHHSRFPIGIPHSEASVFVRDRSRESWRTISRTRMWDDNPDGASLYRLKCTLRSEPPAHVLRRPVAER